MEIDYAALVEGSPHATLVHRDGAVLFANGSAARLFGAAEPKDLVGRCPDDLLKGPGGRPVVSVAGTMLLPGGPAVHVVCWERDVLARSTRAPREITDLNGVLASFMAARESATGHGVPLVVAAVVPDDALPAYGREWAAGDWARELLGSDQGFPTAVGRGPTGELFMVGPGLLPDVSLAERVRTAARAHGFDRVGVGIVEDDGRRPGELVETAARRARDDARRTRWAAAFGTGRSRSTLPGLDEVDLRGRHIASQR